jgi:hypothetical protein
MSAITKRITKSALLVAILIVTFSGAAQAERLHVGFGVRVVPRWDFGLGMRPFYDPFWGPFYPYGFYPYVVNRPTAAVKVEAVPKQAEVFVDGYFAGTPGTVRTTPGGHAITLYLPGYRTITQDIYVAPGSTVKMRDSMDRLAPGEVSALPPAPDRSMSPAAHPHAGTPNSK